MTPPFTIGQRVTDNRTLDWGSGRVIKCLETRVYVRFRFGPYPTQSIPYLIEEATKFLFPQD